MTGIVEHVGPDGEVSRLPAGERVLWSGAPDKAALARYVFRERWVLAFVAASFALGAAEALQHADATPRLIGVGTLSLILAAVAVVSIRVFSWQIARSSSYFITNRRVYFNIGIVLRADANVPFSSVETVDLLRRKDGSADLMVTLTDESPEIPWLLLFPHMTWRGSRRGRPTFLALRAPQQAADIVVAALRDYAQPSSSSEVARATAVASPSGRAMAGAVAPSPA